MAWGIGGWLILPFLQKLGVEGSERLRRRVATGLETTFVSSYANEVSLAGALQLEAISAYVWSATGSKFLIIPNG